MNFKSRAGPCGFMLLYLCFLLMEGVLKSVSLELRNVFALEDTSYEFMCILFSAVIFCCHETNHKVLLYVNCWVTKTSQIRLEIAIKIVIQYIYS